MAVSKEKIQYNYSKMIELAAELNEIRNELESIRKSFDGSLDDLGMYWKGDASDDYRKQGSGVSGFMQDHIDYLTSVATGIRKTAKAYREAENAKLEQTE